MNRLVLIVEDDEMTRTVLSKMVEMCGREVITAATISEGMDQLRSAPSHLLLDLNLPDGLGTTLLKHVRSAHLPVKVAVVSGSSDKALLGEVKSLAPDAMFTKPPDWDALMDWIAG